jgi:NAD+ synthase
MDQGGLTISFKLDINLEETIIIIGEFLKTYVENANVRGVVIGLSGGIDSAVTAVLCKKILGEEKILCIFMPDETTPASDEKHQAMIIEKFNLPFIEIEIAPIIHRFSSVLNNEPQKEHLANIKARTRMILLYHYALQQQRLVCGASNKSEFLTGYYTKYGDGGADIQPIADLYKTQVYQLAQYLKIPKPLLIKPPTAGLWRGQTDEQELGMTYITLDQILYGLELKYTNTQIAKEVNIPKEEVERIRQLRIRSQHKRRLPLIPKIGTRTPGFDWRVPVQEG